VTAPVAAGMLSRYPSKTVPNASTESARSAGVHPAELGFPEICGHPQVIDLRHQRDLFPGGHTLANFSHSLGHNPSPDHDLAIGQIQDGLIEL